jgi:H2-forming N5,N10-methylenetetrahydromethanopterin dehydrogenase-like enzyme
MSDLIVADEEYSTLRQALGAFGDAAEEQVIEYLRILASLCDNAVIEGITARNLKSFALSACSIMGKTKELTEYMQSACDALVASIDQADEYLYD